MINTHSDAPAIVVGDWATGRWIADAIGVANASFVSHKIMKSLIEEYGLKKDDLSIHNRNERNDGKGLYSFYHVPTIRRWCSAKGRSFSAPDSNGLRDLDRLIVGHASSFVLWMVKNENDVARSLFDKYLDHATNLINNKMKG